MPRLQFLSSADPLTKSYALEADGSITKTPYPNAYFFTSHEEQVDTVAQFAAAITAHAEQGHCLLKGQLAQPLSHERRAGSTSTMDPTDWICLDLDGLAPKFSVDKLLEQLGLGDVSYVLQWSASYLIPKDNTDLRCHVFMLLDKPVPAPQLKDWLVHLNLSNEFLRSSTRLSASGSTLKWGLDTTACQNDKLLYITNPELRGIPNPFGRNKSRISVVKKPKAKLSLTVSAKPEANRAEQTRRINELRLEAGLPEKKSITYKEVASAGVRAVSSADEATITGMREDRGFVYFNLNGGDSWAYYHPRDNADVIYSFKGEEPVLTSKLLPDYYLEAKAQAKRAKSDFQRETNKGIDDAKTEDTTTEAARDITLLAFRDINTSKYMTGRYYRDTDELELYEAKSEKQVRDFCMQFGLGIGEYIPLWDLRFDPQSTERIDREKMQINTFRMSPMLKQRRLVKQYPPTIKKLIHHALGNNEAITDHFMNWLAYIVQRRTRTNTAWVLYGVEGTGKGVLLEHVLKPLLGPGNVGVNRVDELSGGYNGFLKNKLLMAFDEAHVGAMKDAEEIMGRMRNMITEPTISIRDLYASARPVDNHLNILIFSNKRDAVLLTAGDRRYNVGHYQQVKLIEAFPEIGKDWSKYEAKIQSEVKDFAAWLLGYEMREAEATQVLNTDERSAMIEATSSSADDIAHALAGRFANMGTLLDMLPSNDTYKQDMKELGKVELYRKTLMDVMVRTMERLAKPNRAAGDAESVISREELHAIFEYTVGNAPTTPNKFTKYLKHRHIDIKKVWIGGATVAGLATTFGDSKKFPEFIEALAHKKVKPAAPPAKKVKT